eukprot:14602807-Heterocapsa_arctica.AAC.1
MARPSPKRGVPCGPLRETAAFAQRGREADCAEQERLPRHRGPGASGDRPTLHRDQEAGLRRLQD